MRLVSARIGAKRAGGSVMAEDFYESAAAGISDLKDADPELGPMLDYYDAVLRAQAKTAASFQPDLAALDLDLGRKRNGNGLPFLRPADVVPDGTLFDALLKRIAETSLQRAEAETSDSADSWRLGASDSADWRDAFVESALGRTDGLDQLAQRAGIHGCVFPFLAYRTLTPFVEPYARYVKDSIEEDKWRKGYCPVCGGEPLMGRLEEETGKRFLECHVCRTLWLFSRMECPFCGTTDQEKLRYLYDEEDRSYRIEVCDACKGYLKTVDARERQNPACLFVENLATVHLDLVARKEGFQRDTNKLFGL
jgi:FdhE protein